MQLIIIRYLCILYAKITDNFNLPKGKYFSQNMSTVQHFEFHLLKKVANTRNLFKYFLSNMKMAKKIDKIFLKLMLVYMANNG